ncbi:SDR family NAD(P)-dependent oxidoreductase [Chromobacterium piscinae]|uniref:SDR family NAD(P)-dependent oxidoreductase n=1 Tax=Chromobacterium piscinae TaxID=686831 RepID=UPI001E473D28|nr:SDR family oxidoreductase [Chromobacterium piscinae]MCD5327529.1 SDR family oxidoreductase [Chromobacterium piscinae]
MRMVILGASSGLGAGLAEGLPIAGDRVWLVNRSEPTALHLQDGVDRIWIPCDLANPSEVAAITSCIGEEGVDLLLFCTGTWETNPDIATASDEEIYRVLAINTSAFVASVKSLAPNLRKSRGKVVAIASTAALENATGPRAAYAASKFGLRGAVHSFRQYFRPDGVTVTVISPGGIASDVPWRDGIDAALERYGSRRIPIEDFRAVIRLILSVSSACCLKEIDMPAMGDLDA